MVRLPIRNVGGAGRCHEDQVVRPGVQPEVQSPTDDARPTASRMMPPGHRDDVERLSLSHPPAVCEDITRPRYTLPVCAQDRFKICPSVMKQADGFAHALLGVRFERDVLAKRHAESYCSAFGAPGLGVPLSGFDGLYFLHFDDLPEVIATMASHHARGAIVVPKRSFGGPTISGVYGKPKYGKKRKRSKATPKSWYEFLLSKTRLVMEVPASAVTSSSGATFASEEGLLIVYAEFEFVGKFKAKQSKVKKISIVPNALLADQATKIGVLPVVVTRSSPLATGVAPGKDVVPASEPFPAPPAGAPSPPDPPNLWKIDAFRKWCAEYPHPEVADMALKAVQRVFDPGFEGSLTKAVRTTNSPKIRGREDEVRAHLMKEVDAGRMWGPVKYCPFEHARLVRLSLAPKFKWDLSRREFRLISDLSRFGSSSVNDLCRSPDWISFHLMASHLRDRIDEVGRGCCVFAVDVPKCFRRQTTWKRLLQLFTYRLVSGSGEEFFTDLCNTFGFRPSEYVWQAILAVLLWQCRLRLGCAPPAFVDNFFLFRQGEAAARSVGEKFVAMCSEVGIEFHELQVGPNFNGLGWDWRCKDGATGMMVCPDDKYKGVLGMLNSLKEKSSMSLHEAEKAAGVMNFVAAGFEIGRPDVGAIMSLRTQLQAKAKRECKAPEDVFLPIMDEVRKAIDFWCEFWPRWNKQYPIVGGFSPLRSWQALGFVDASTCWGCGGVLVMDGVAVAFMHEWSAEERASAFVKDRESTGRLELYGVAHWLERFGTRCANKRLLLCGDNSAAVRGLDRCYSSNPALYPPLLEARRTCANNHITLRSRYIPTTLNVIADALSKGDFAQALCHARNVLGLELLLLQ
jgi:hypothetical protein